MVSDCILQDPSNKGPQYSIFSKYIQAKLDKSPCKWYYQRSIFNTYWLLVNSHIYCIILRLSI